MLAIKQYAPLVESLCTVEPLVGLGFALQESQQLLRVTSVLCTHLIGGILPRELLGVDEFTVHIHVEGAVVRIRLGDVIQDRRHDENRRLHRLQLQQQRSKGDVRRDGSLEVNARRMHHIVEKRHSDDNVVRDGSENTQRKLGINEITEMHHHLAGILVLRKFQVLRKRRVVLADKTLQIGHLVVVLSSFAQFKAHRLDVVRSRRFVVFHSPVVRDCDDSRFLPPLAQTLCRRCPFTHHIQSDIHSSIAVFLQKRRVSS